MTDSPIEILLSVAVAVVIGVFWFRDFLKSPATVAADASVGESSRMPGATPCAVPFLVFAAVGGLVLTLLETSGELLLGISPEQRNISALFFAAMLAAAVVEEVVFRGYLVLEGRGRAPFLIGIIAASFAFALMHDFLWSFGPTEGLPVLEYWRAFSFRPALKNFYSTGVVFVVSLYFYFLRFHPANTHCSLLPCILAHALRNLSVFVLKFAQGHVTSWF